MTEAFVALGNPEMTILRVPLAVVPLSAVTFGDDDSRSERDCNETVGGTAQLGAAHTNPAYTLGGVVAPAEVASGNRANKSGTDARSPMLASMPVDLPWARLYVRTAQCGCAISSMITWTTNLAGPCSAISCLPQSTG